MLTGGISGSEGLVSCCVEFESSTFSLELPPFFSNFVPEGVLIAMFAICHTYNVSSFVDLP